MVLAGPSRELHHHGGHFDMRSMFRPTDVIKGKSFSFFVDTVSGLYIPSPKDREVGLAPLFFPRHDDWKGVLGDPETSILKFYL